MPNRSGLDEKNVTDLNWEHDLVLPPGNHLSLSTQSLKSKASFSSHISDTSDDNAPVSHKLPSLSSRASRLLSSGQRSAHSSASSLASHSEDNEDAFDHEAAFKLSSSLEKFSFSPKHSSSSKPVQQLSIGR